ncbi:MAG TPA: DciA family protein [Marmoricola sp.]|mgnify:CR=1 FL=1|nr:DciA family protein [Marmoricola sp.]
MSDETSPTHDETGTDLARSIARGLAGRTRKVRRPRTSPPTPPRASSAHPDDRDPALIDVTLERLVEERGWHSDLQVHGLFLRWAALVGREVADHVTPISFEDGRLVVQADTTAWAQQMKLLAATVVRRLNQELGDETVRFVDVRGPKGPTWVKGKLRVKGRGPRDTYG